MSLWCQLHKLGKLGHWGILETGLPRIGIRVWNSATQDHCSDIHCWSTTIQGHNSGVQGQKSAICCQNPHIRNWPKEYVARALLLMIKILASKVEMLMYQVGTNVQIQNSKVQGQDTLVCSRSESRQAHLEHWCLEAELLFPIGHFVGLVINAYVSLTLHHPQLLTAVSEEMNQGRSRDFCLASRVLLLISLFLIVFDTHPLGRCP